MSSNTAKHPAQSPIENYLKALHARHAALDDGEVADYIPELANANAHWFGISLATRDGHVYEVGDTRQTFTIQSISKALAYGLALEDRGEDFILSRISVEPSGDAFNAISLKAESGAPFNPMINAGAIATCGQIQKRDGRSRIERILAYLSACAGRPLSIDQAVYRSESDTGHRNRAIGWMLRNFGIIDEEPTEILETYFQQCAIQVNCRDLAVIAATLANHGRNPLTHEQAIAPEYVENILSVMASCGMYDFSGEWLYHIGLPAKSGVGGGVLAALPGQLGIGVFSPPLDAQGNSARGIRVCTDLSHDLSLHLFANGPQLPASIRLSYDASQVASRRQRAPEARQVLLSSGHRIRLLELQGELNFVTTETVIRAALKQAPYCQYLILNCRNVASLDDVTRKLFEELKDSLENQGVQLHLCPASRLLALAPAIAKLPLHADDDAALEYCENQLLAELIGPDWDQAPPVEIGNTHLLRGLPADDLAWLAREMPTHDAASGECIIEAGDNAESLFLLLSGTVEVRLPEPSGKSGKRVGVFVAGMSFGEMGLIDGAPRSAHVLAHTPVVYRVIDRALFDRLETERPKLKIRLLERLACQISDNLRRSNREIAAFKN
ncbi:glutaminase A [Azonexus sp.]|uniref:glutaminase A n=1 Tax=Azonexus sp. TaxID=1872668 RepID=UPI0027B881F1|nr:glutaminase A [Azonexus sp.]